MEAVINVLNAFNYLLALYNSPASSIYLKQPKQDTRQNEFSKKNPQAQCLALPSRWLLLPLEVTVWV